MDLHIGYGVLVSQTHKRTGKTYMEFHEAGAQSDKKVDIFQLLPTLQKRIERARLAREEQARESHREAGR